MELVRGKVDVGIAVVLKAISCSISAVVRQGDLEEVRTYISFRRYTYISSSEAQQSQQMQRDRCSLRDWY